MEHSYNGWPASPTLATRVIEPIPGVKFRIADNENIATIFTYVVQQYNRRVEPVAGPVPDDWGFAYRADKNNPNELSCHASGSAIDLNALKHPNGKKGTFSAAQIAEMHKIIAEVDGTVQCGEFYSHTTDGMHWEINVPPGHLQATGARLRKAALPHTPRTAGFWIEKSIEDAMKAKGGPDRLKTRDEAVALLKSLRK